MPLSSGDYLRRRAALRLAGAFLAAFLFAGAFLAAPLRAGAFRLRAGILMSITKTISKNRDDTMSTVLLRNTSCITQQNNTARTLLRVHFLYNYRTHMN